MKRGTRWQNAQIMCGKRNAMNSVDAQNGAKRQWPQKCAEAAASERTATIITTLQFSRTERRAAAKAAAEAAT